MKYQRYVKNGVIHHPSIPSICQESVWNILQFSLWFWFMLNTRVWHDYYMRF